MQIEMYLGSYCMTIADRILEMCLKIERYGPGSCEASCETLSIYSYNRKSTSQRGGKVGFFFLSESRVHCLISTHNSLGLKQIAEYRTLIETRVLAYCFFKYLYSTFTTNDTNPIFSHYVNF